MFGDPTFNKGETIAHGSSLAEKGHAFWSLLLHINRNHPCPVIQGFKPAHDVNNTVVVQAQRRVSCVESHQGWLCVFTLIQIRQHIISIISRIMEHLGMSRVLQ